jgi:hypothetical protein
MKTLVIINVVAVCLLTGGITASAQTTETPAQNAGAGIAATRVFGEVMSIDAAKQRMTVRTEAGEFEVLLNDKTKYLRIPPGEETMEKAETITFADISVGDRAIARGQVSAEQKVVQARQIVVMSKAAIVQKRAHDREEWRRRGIVGRIASLDPATKVIALSTTTSEGEKKVALTVADKTGFRRYSADTVKFTETLPSSFGELKVGDQVRALGEKSADGTSFAAEEIVSGSFYAFTGKITAINVAASEITLTDQKTKQPITVVISKDSLIRRLSPEIIALLMRQPKVTPAGTASPSSATSIQEKIENLPAITINDLKPGDAVRVSTTHGANASRVTAISLAAGVEELLKAQESKGLSAPTNASLGLASGALDGIGLP